MVERDKTRNVCQYWREDEPNVCGHWDPTINRCTKVEVKNRPEGGQIEIYPTRYPYCNLIGTASQCSYYDGTGTEARCVLPDPFRHVCNRYTGKKWVYMRAPAQYDETGDMLQAADWSFDDITEYNDGDCDGYGTAQECAGYSPYHMGFGYIQPEGLPDNWLDILEEPWEGYKTADDLGFRLPLLYVILNARAKLSRCAFWSGDVEEFTVDEDLGYVNPINFLCTNSDDNTNEFSEQHFDGSGRFIPPCNGAHDECPHYTGICWQHCIVDKMQSGDKVLAEQILEIRYYLRKETWTLDDYTKSFAKPDIFSWTGPDGIHYAFTNTGELDPDNTLIESMKVYQEEFNTLNIQYKNVTLSEGTPAQDGNVRFPTLVGPIKELYLKPIIRNSFDSDFFGNNLFEVTSLHDTDVLIYGDTFWYDSNTYAINLLDPDIQKIIPTELFEYEDMHAIEMALSTDSEDYFTEFNDNLDYILTNIITYMPEKVFTSEFGKNSTGFYINFNAQFGSNLAFVFNKGSGRWEFDKVSFVVSLCGGVIKQHSFSIINKDDKPVDKLPWYERNFYSLQNDNGAIDFQYQPFTPTLMVSGTAVDHLYNDHFTEVLAGNPLFPPDYTTYHQSYVLYKVTAYENLIITKERMKFLGSSGYVVINMPDPDKKLSNVHRPWEASNDFYLSITDVDGNSKRIKMEVHEQGTSRLEVNQIVLKPKNLNDFSQACDAMLFIDELYVYQKRSFDETPEGTYEEVNEEDVSDDDNLVYWGRYQDLAYKDNHMFTLSKFNSEPMFISVVYKGANGRIKGITRTKLITWIRQPFCRDVEIYYRWSSSYIKWLLKPDFDCLISDMDFIMEGRLVKSLSPPCGDHDLKVFAEPAPMWYPYNACPPYDRYDIITQFTEWDTSIIEQFVEANEDLFGEHGAFDMRMMGPYESYAYTCETHARLRNCNCDWSYCNDIKEIPNGNVFVGYGRYRGGLSGEAIGECTFNGGKMPRFGNVHRDFLRSYRSMDNVFYYVIEGIMNFEREYKWMPMYEMYSKCDLTADANDYPYRLYTKDYNSPFVNQMSLLLFNSLIENVAIYEQLDEEHRFRFEDIIESKHSTSTLMYPYPKNVYLVGSNLNPLVSWYRFKDYPYGLDKSIQWVWQEDWEDMLRYNISNSDFMYDQNYDEGSEETEDSYNLPYSYDGSTVVGRHMFLDIEYPDYQYDAYLEEHRLVCDEGEHTIKVVPCKPNKEGDIYFLLLLDDGPFRIFDLSGDWVTTDPGVEFGDEYDPDVSTFIDLYNSCDNEDWVADVTLYDENTPSTTTEETSKTAARDDERVIEAFDSVGSETETFYQRGLNVSLDTSQFSKLPYKETLFRGEPADVSIDPVPTNEDTLYSSLAQGEFVAMLNNSFNIEYDSSLNSFFIIVDFEANDDEESLKRVISKINMAFYVGSVPPSGPDADTSEEAWNGTLYHIPAISVYSGNSLTSMSHIHTTDSMTLYSKEDSGTFETKSYDMDFSYSDMANAYRYLKIVFRIEPTAAELESSSISEYFAEATSKVRLSFLDLFYVEFVEAEEPITTYERLYYVSYGSHGDFPPHGTDSSGALLYPIYGDGSTVYQQDSRNGVVGMPGSGGVAESMNKCRGRIMKEVHEDKELLPGRDVYEWEALQKGVHDDIAINSGSTTINAVGTAPPNMRSKLAEAGAYFQPWSCVFTNTIVKPLAEVLPKETYSPCGHEYFHDTSTLDLDEWEDCSGVLGRQWANDRFDYGYRNACSDGPAQWHSLTVFDAYLRSSLGVYFKNPLVFKQADAKRLSMIAPDDNTTEETTDMSIPKEIRPFI